MAFTVPDFNLVCNVFRGPYLTRVLAITDLPCNLAFSRRGQIPSAFQVNNEWSPIMSLLVPAGSDLRSLVNAAVEDVVECPSGSGRWYQVGGVDDIGKGFPNEHRCALLFQISAAMLGASYGTLAWPAPMP
jgi:hypothetical protein